MRGLAYCGPSFLGPIFIGSLPNARFILDNSDWPYCLVYPSTCNCVAYETIWDPQGPSCIRSAVLRSLKNRSIRSSPFMMNMSEKDLRKRSLRLCRIETSQGPD